MSEADRPKWEYKTESHLNYGQRDGYNAGPNFLHWLGDEGWELMAISIVSRVSHYDEPAREPTRWNDETFYFKRRKESP